MDLNQGVPSFSFESAMSSLEGATALSSEEGDLLLYSNGENVWNSSHQPIPSVSQINGSSNARQSALLLQHTEDNITLITNGSQFSEENLGLNYHKISTPSGYQITSANNLLQPAAAEGMAAVEIKQCVSREYWLITGKIDNPGYLYLYRVTPDSVFFQSRMRYGGQYPVKYIKFSPRVDHVVVLEDKGDSKSSAWLIDFDPLSGAISNPTEILERENVFLESAEFSSSGELLYISLDRLFQYNVITNSIIGSIDEPAVAMQLASEDQIILLLYPGIAILDSINAIGLGDIDILELPQEVLLSLRQGLPSFPSSYFNYTLKAQAGPDIELCSRQSAVLGGSSIGEEFIWTPDMYLDDPFSRNPVFTKVNDSNTIDTLIYALEVRNSQLVSCDTVEVIVYPEPNLQIFGPQSVCPGESDLLYSFQKVFGYNYQWSVINGDLLDLFNDNVSVTWPDSVGSAYVQLSIGSETTECKSDTSTLEVVINYEIDSPLPIGDTLICSEKRDSNIYSVPLSPNAVYLWEAINGDIVSGQGSSAIVVDWTSDDPNIVRMEQTITTEDTVCFGQSPDLAVNFIEDSSSLDLLLVTIDTTSNNSIRVLMDNYSNQPNSNPIYVWRSIHKQNQFSEIASLASSVAEYVDPNVDVDQNAYDYYISQSSWCDNNLLSSTHNSILLNHTGLFDSKSVGLSYNEYEAWQTDSYAMLLLHANDMQVTEQILEELSSYTSPVTVNDFPLAFDHFFRVGAFYDNQLISWSNRIEIKLTPSLMIPNVFTPNNDGINDTFDFLELELFPNNVLELYDRTGSQIATFEDYGGNWDGGGYPSGTYFYLFREFRTGSSYTGWVKILR